MNKIGLISLFLLLCAGLTFGQRDSIPEGGQDDHEIQSTIEDAIQGADTEEDTDWTIVTDYLEDLKKSPLNLNDATKEQMTLIPGFTDVMANNLIEHIAKFGPLTSVFELQAISGFTRESYLAIEPYVTVKEIKAKDIGKQKHAKGPGFSQIMSGLKGELLVRGITILEEQKGYTAPDTSSTGTLSSRYAGSPWRFYNRFRLRFNQNVSIGVLGEKDSGEEFKWDPDTQTYGFDFTSAHFYLKDFGNVKRLAVGDYNIQVGQGLLLSRGLGFGKGAQTVSAVKRPDLGIRPYASVNENQFLRGAATTIAVKDFYFTGFVSRNSRDANIATEDTTTSTIETISTLQTSGLHRTTSEIEDKDAISETLIGGRVAFKKDRLTIGTTHFVENLSSTLSPTNRDYQYYNFAGNQNYLNGVDVDWTVKNFNFFGEFGRSKSGGTGTIAGFMGSLNPKFEVSMLFRHLEKDFHSSHGFIFAERPTAVQNETGMYLGVKAHPFKKWTVSAYFDQFIFPWHRYQASYPSRGHEYLAQVEYKPSRETQMYVRYRSDHKERNASEFPETQQLDYIVPTRKDNFRIHFDHKITKNMRIKSRAEYSFFTKGDEEKHEGFMLYQDFIWKMNYKLRFTGRYAIFDIEDSDARIFAYENDILGFFSIPGYNGKASRFYAIVNYKPVKGLEFWVRFARTHFHLENTVGSGLEEIKGANRSELKLQMRYSF